MITEIGNNSWKTSIDKNIENKLLKDIEEGKVIFLSSLKFDLLKEEQKFLKADYADKKSKNISFDPKTKDLRGSSCKGEDLVQLKAMIVRFAQSSRVLIDSLFPYYKSSIRIGRTSFRPLATERRRITSVRKDDSKLHIDSFASQPVQGCRLLRVFSNINMEAPRVWKLGDSFENVADRFLPQISHKQRISPYLLHKFGITKTVRSDYDYVMLQIHNSMKQDDDYQNSVIQQEVSFPSSSTWVVMTDKVSHAALAGQFLLEQTFYLPPDAMKEPSLSPLYILEEKLKKRLV